MNPRIQATVRPALKKWLMRVAKRNHMSHSQALKELVEEAKAKGWAPSRSRRGE